MNVLKQAFLIWVKEIESAKLIWKDSWLVFIIFFASSYQIHASVLEKQPAYTS